MLLTRETNPVIEIVRKGSVSLTYSVIRGVASMKHLGCSAIVILVFATTLASAEQPPEQSPIAGVTAVVVDASTAGGIDEDWFQLLVVQELRKSGIRVLDKSPSNSHVPRLVVSSTLTCRGDACGYTTRLRLDEQVKTVRNPGKESAATTWMNGYQNAIPSSEMSALKALISVDLATLVRLFAIDAKGSK